MAVITRIANFYLTFQLIALAYSENVSDGYVSFGDTQATSNPSALDTARGHNSVTDVNPEKFDYPEKKLETLSHDLEAAARNNPFYKIPSYDHKIRMISEEHEALFRSLGVYVIHNDNENEFSELDDRDLDHSLDGSNKSDAKTNNIYDMFDKSELLDAMTPEEKLHYIPKLKDAISHEIATQKERLEKIRDKIASKSNI